MEIIQAKAGSILVRIPKSLVAIEITKRLLDELAKTIEKDSKDKFFDDVFSCSKCDK